MEEAKGVKVESVSFLMGQGALACFVKALTSWKKSVILTNVQVNKKTYLLITLKAIFYHFFDFERAWTLVRMVPMFFDLWRGQAKKNKRMWPAKNKVVQQ